MKIIRHTDSKGQIQLAGSKDGRNYFRLTGDLMNHALTAEPADVKKLLAPLEPSQVLCIGLNYRKHAEETGAPIPTTPVLFAKVGRTVQNPGDPIELPRALRSNEVDYECELAVVIGKPCKNATRENALSFVAGYTCVNDVSARDWQLHKDKSGGQWCRGKSFDTFTPLGPCLVTTDEITDPQTLAIKTVLNGKVMQSSHTSDMIFSIRDIIVFLSGSLTLVPGTVICTGTPAGVGLAFKPPVWLQAGDSVTIEIENIGALTNSVVEEVV